MNPVEFAPRHPASQPRGRWIALSLAALLLAACGAETKTGSTGTGSVPSAAAEPLVASGTVNALGPTGVGSITLEDSSARLQLNANAPRPVTELRLGMQLEAAGSIVSSESAGTATGIVAQSAAVGPVASVDPARGRMTLLSLNVQVDQNTIFDGLSSLAALTAGTRVEVFGLPQAAPATLLATRIIRLPADSSAPVELLGNAANLTSTQFSLQGIQVAAGSAQVSIGGVLPSPAPPLVTVATNSRVRAIGSFDAATNTLTATQIIGGLNPVRTDNALLVLDGVVQAVTSAGRFRLNDTEVDASAAGGGGATAGARVQVRGRKLAGVLVASEYRQIAAGERISFSVQGEISDFASVAAFRVRGELVSANTAIFSGGSASDLANGKRVRVRAVAGAGQLEATQITFVTP